MKQKGFLDGVVFLSVDGYSMPEDCEQNVCNFCIKYKVL